MGLPSAKSEHKVGTHRNQFGLKPLSTYRYAWLRFADAASSVAAAAAAETDLMTGSSSEDASEEGAWSMAATRRCTIDDGHLVAERASAAYTPIRVTYDRQRYTFVSDEV